MWKCNISIAYEEVPYELTSAHHSLPSFVHHSLIR